MDGFQGKEKEGKEKTLDVDAELNVRNFSLEMMRPNFLEAGQDLIH